MAMRNNPMSPTFTRFSYWLWNSFWYLFLSIRSKFKGELARFDLAGSRVLLDMRDRTVTRALYLFREYEPSETKMLVGLLRLGMTFIDIGANTGYFTLLAAKNVGLGGRVIAFEPCPENVEILRRNVSINKLRNVMVVKAAITNAHQPVTLHLCEINDGDHRIYDGKDDEFYNAGLPRRTITVQGFTLDEYLRLHGLTADVIKMDIQGAEYIALQGMKNALCQNRDVALMVEYWPHGLKRCGTQPKQFIKEMRRLGFNTHAPSADGQVTPIKIAEIHERTEGKNALTLLFSRNGMFV
jgi:FkbM family methyltransferase